jgi:hypothetical protein
VTGQLDTFDIVKSWWGQKTVNSDTQMIGINLSTEQGAFESLILGILYSIEDTGPDIKNTLLELRKRGFTNISFLSQICEDSKEYEDIYKIWVNNYFGGRLPQKISYMLENARYIFADKYLCGDIRDIYNICAGDGYKILRWLWTLAGIKKKAFWLTREMRMQGVWNIDGKYCCVPDKQVGKSLERWNKIEKWPEYNNFKICLQCSQTVWDSFGTLYDFPILLYAREYKCNNKSQKRCDICRITSCKDRPIGLPLLIN